MIEAPMGKNGKPIRERICIYGPPKIGKTHLFFTIAKWHQDLGSDAIFYGVSSDTSYEVLSMNPEFDHLTNIKWADVVHYQDYLDAARDYSQIMRPHDWLSVDLMSDAWPSVQDEYARITTIKAGGNLEDMGDLWATSGSTEEYPIAGWEWQMPNARYRILANNILLRCPGHLFLVYGQKELMQDSGSGRSGESKQSKEMFGHIGLKPAGQKDDPFRYHTILHVDGNGEMAQKISTAGERWGYREWLGQKMSNGSVRDEAIDDFFMDYLVKVAGWTT